MLFYSNRKAHPFSISDVPIYKSIFHLLQAPPVTVYKPLFFNVSSTILMSIYCPLSFNEEAKETMQEKINRMLVTEASRQEM